MNSEAIAFSGCCETCLGSIDGRGEVIGHRAATVQGTLRLEADLGFATCRRGHRMVVRRLTRALIPVPAQVAPQLSA